MRRSSTATLLTLVALLGVGCHDDSVPSRTVQDAGTSFSVRGVAQKGPFKFGSTVTVQELETDLAPNGRTFITETLDDLGTFALTSRLSAPLVEIIIDGEYYNEWWGADPTGEPAPLVRLPLRALVPARGSADAGVLTVNVNLLTHLQLPRQRVLPKATGAPRARPNVRGGRQSVARGSLGSLSDSRLGVWELSYVEHRRGGRCQRDPPGCFVDDLVATTGSPCERLEYGFRLRDHCSCP
jgi:hypothetical protein